MAINNFAKAHSDNLDRLRKKYPAGSTTMDKQGNLSVKKKAVAGKMKVKPFNPHKDWTWDAKRRKEEGDNYKENKDRK